ncbi:MAG: sigma-70 family RNA polymerase sigma factor [Planctomycetales bacterium]
MVKDPGNNIQSEAPSENAPSITMSLLARLRAGDPEGWDRLSKLYCPLVYRWCKRARLQYDDASDIVQEVFRTVALKIDSFRRERKGDTFRGWLWTITRHKLGDYIRRQQNRPQPTGGSDAAAMLHQVADPFGEDSDSFVQGGDYNSLYHRALDLIKTEFEEPSWKAFWMVVVEDKTAAQAAEELGLSANAVYIAKSRILARLRQELGDLDPS